MRYTLQEKEFVPPPPLSQIQDLHAGWLGLPSANGRPRHSLCIQQKGKMEKFNQLTARGSIS